MTTITATYSPEDNKLRLYASQRLPRELYDRIKAAGFTWAPKQDLFVAPAWSPYREDLAIELAGEIEDEDRSLVQRAEDRADRFADYSDKRASDAHRAREAVAKIADGIPLGQPILIGHHSQRRAERDAEKIDNGMRRAVQLWDTADYWKQRAAGAIGAAKYKERPDVRARRIKTLEAEQRKIQRSREACAKLVEFYSDPATASTPSRHYPDKSARAAMLGCYGGGLSYEQQQAFNAGTFSEAEAVEKALSNQRRGIAGCDRWLSHYANRLTYERAMLDESGYIAPPKKPTKAVLPLLNYAGAVEYRNPYTRGEVITAEAHPMTKAEFAAIGDDYKGTRIAADGLHRVRVAYTRLAGRNVPTMVVVFLTDSKVHPKPGAGPFEGDEAEKVAARMNKAYDTIQNSAKTRAKVAAHNRAVIAAHAEGAPVPKLEAAEPMPAAPTAAEVQADIEKMQQRNQAHEHEKAEAAPFEALRQAVKAGVQVVAAPQLFPTPVDLAARMVEAAGIKAGDHVLEPSAGTGVLIGACGAQWSGWNANNRGAMHAVEINGTLCDRLRHQFPLTNVHHRDFLDLSPDTFQPFDVVLMNPPFKDAADIVHIRHALRFLKPGGRLVAICANGPRQQAALRPLVEQHGGEWEELPPGTFSESGTEVRTVMLSLTVTEYAEA